MELPTLAVIRESPLLQYGSWVVANLDTPISWPLEITQIHFRNRTLYLIPYTKESDTLTFPAAVTQIEDGEDYATGQILLYHFLSSLAWVERSGIDVAHWSGGSFPMPMGGCKRMPHVVSRLYKPYLPDPREKKCRWALAFYREGLSLNHVAYRCLSFFKILNIFLRTGAEQKEWINTNFGKINDHGARARVSELESTLEDIGDYLYTSNRCAVAHAGADPTVDPESPEDLGRLRKDLPLVQALAETAIESHFGVKGSTTIWNEHHYELAGFKKVLGNILCTDIASGKTIDKNSFPRFPNVSVRLHFHQMYDPLEGMSVTPIGADDGFAIVLCTSRDQLTSMVLILNFRDERLQIDVIGGLKSTDDGSVRSARYAAAVSQFKVDYIMNGILEVWNADDQQLLGRCDAFVPVNLDMAATSESFKNQIDSLIREAELRDQRSEK